MVRPPCTSDQQWGGSTQSQADPVANTRKRSRGRAGRARGACWPDLDAGWRPRHWSIGARLERILGVHRIGALVPLTPPGWVQAGRHLLAGLELAVDDVNHA